jgi:hypothetical protein
VEVKLYALYTVDGGDCFSFTLRSLYILVKSFRYVPSSLRRPFLAGTEPHCILVQVSESRDSTVGLATLSPGMKRPGLEVDHSSSVSAEVKAV